MQIKKLSLILLLTFASSTLLANENQEASATEATPQYNAHHGPYSQNIAGVAHLALKEGFVSMDESDTQRYMEEMHNPGITNSWYFSPNQGDKWFAIFDFNETGHVSDEEKIDTAAVLESLKEANTEGNKERASHGWAPLTLVGWRVEPHYESDTKRLSWATLLESEGRQTINYRTKILGRTGVVDVILVTSPENLDSSIAELKTELAGFEFDSGQRYNEFKQGDKVAEYGLTGLIVGGAAAVAAKSGFFKWIGGALLAGWKIIAVAAVGLVSWLKSLLGRKNDD